MTRETIEQELAHHRQLREQFIANANAAAGVVQYLEAKLAALPEEKRIVVPGPGDFVPALRKRD